MRNGRHQFSKFEIEKVKNNLKENIIGQDEVCKAVITMLESNRIRTDNDGILGYFFLVGVSGCGKNHLVKQISDALSFHLEIIDCSNFSYVELSSLLGVTNGFEASSKPSLLETIHNNAINKNNDNGLVHPKILIYFDEVDKLHLDSRSSKNPAMEMLLSVMNLLERSKQTLKNGNVIDISNYIICFGSNLYLDQFKVKKPEARKIGFDIEDKKQKKLTEKGHIPKSKMNNKSTKNMVLECLQRDLSISIYARIKDHVLVFNSIGKKLFESIFEKEYLELIKNIKDNITFNFNDFPNYKKYYKEFKHLLNSGVDGGGARQIKQIMNQQVKMRIMEEYLKIYMDNSGSAFLERLNTSNMYKKMLDYNDEFDFTLNAIPF